MNSGLKAVAKKVVWFQTAEETLRNPDQFLAHVMRYGDVDDWLIAEQHYQKEDFKAVLRKPPSGVFDERSWYFWHLRLGLEHVGPLPERRFD